MSTLEFRIYNRPFRTPLHTSHGIWQIRRGILLKQTDPDGSVHWGEITPLEPFGTETLEEAIAFCETISTAASPQLSSPQLSSPQLSIATPPLHLPATTFGIALLSAAHSSTAIAAPHCQLLPNGLRAIADLQKAPPDSTFKWKIGIAPVQQELDSFAQLMDSLPKTAKLRLDANGGLDLSATKQWLTECDRHPQVEFLEQPLPPSEFATMQALSDRYTTPLALDESVTTLVQMQACHAQGWRGIYVVKAAIAGNPVHLLAFIQAHQLDVVWSSVFETAIARQFITSVMVPAVPWSAHRAIGFGVSHWFTDGWEETEGETIWQMIERETIW
jgi:o-succinylbenzoate synthase